MKRFQKPLLTVIIAVIVIAAVNCMASSFRYTAIKNVPKAVNDLGKMIGQQQRNEVTPGGNEASPGYSYDDQVRFERSGKLAKIVKTVKASKVFSAGVAAIRKLPAETQTKVFEKYAKPIDPTWAMTGQVGNGTTDAGYDVETQIAEALTSAVKKSL